MLRRKFRVFKVGTHVAARLIEHRTPRRRVPIASKTRVLHERSAQQSHCIDKAVAGLDRRHERKLFSESRDMLDDEPSVGLVPLEHAAVKRRRIGHGLLQQRARHK